jgi:serine/threonine protein phosphatase PrpC
MKSQTDPKKSAEKLLQKALQNGGKDNVTVIVIHI